MKLVKSRLLNCTFHSQRSPSGRPWCWLETPCSSNPQSLQVHSTSSSRMLGCQHWHFSRAKGFRQFCLTSSTAWRQLCRHSHGSSSTMERALRTQRRSSPTTWSGRPLATGLWEQMPKDTKEGGPNTSWSTFLTVALDRNPTAPLLSTTPMPWWQSKSSSSYS